MKEHLRSIIWPRQPLDGKGGVKLYRYTIVGILITDQPIDGLEGKTEVLLDGSSEGMANILASVKTKKVPFVMGDASNVLLSLADIPMGDDSEDEHK
jgi:hypothetical protein